MDADRILVDSMLSETRDMDAAKRYDARARTVVGHPPEDVAMGGHSAYPRTVREMPGSDVHHRTSRSMNNRTEQDHRGNYPLCGFGTFDVAARLCPAHDELRNYRRPRRHMSETVSLAEQRRVFQDRWGGACGLMQVAWARADGLCPQATVRYSPRAFRVLAQPPPRGPAPGARSKPSRRR